MDDKPLDLRLVTTNGREDRAGGHYTTNAICGDAMDIIRQLEPNDINWIFLSTSGVHGTYCTLDDVEDRLWNLSDEELRKVDYAEDDEDWKRPTEDDITVLIVLPRMVTTMYGTAIIRTREDVALLRKRVEQTFKGIERLQKGNREPTTNPADGGAG